MMAPMNSQPAHQRNVEIPSPQIREVIAMVCFITRKQVNATIRHQGTHFPVQKLGRCMQQKREPHWNVEPHLAWCSTLQQAALKEERGEQLYIPRRTPK